jgi:hypothetical protein
MESMIESKKYQLHFKHENRMQDGKLSKLAYLIMPEDKEMWKDSERDGKISFEPSEY